MKKSTLVISVSIVFMMAVGCIVLGVILVRTDQEESDQDDDQKRSDDFLTKSFSIKLLDNETHTYGFELLGNIDLMDQEYEYYFDFNDGSSPMRITGKNFTYSYSEIWNTHPILIRKNVAEEIEETLFEAEIPIKYGDYNLYPYAVGAYEKIVVDNSDRQVALSPKGSYDIDGEVIGYYWEFGDGYHSDMRTGIKDGYQSDPIGAHQYEKSGTYSARLWVMDNNFTKSREPWTIEVIVK